MISRSVVDDSTSMASRAIALHREDPSPSLPFALPIDKLMDDAHCRHIAEALKSLGGGWMSKKATKDLWRQLPEEPGLYMFVWTPCLSMTLERAPDNPHRFCWILYIGKTGDRGAMTLRQRYRSGYAKYVERDPEALWDKQEPKGRAARLARYLRIQPLEYWYIVINDRPKIDQLEKRLVALLSPPLNRTGLPKLQINRPEKAF
jgi:hypothetical protein